MSLAASNRSSKALDRGETSAADQVAALQLTIKLQSEQIAALTHQLDWLKRQLFGAKSERFAPAPDPAQMSLHESFDAPASDAPAAPTTPVPAHTRKARWSHLDDEGALPDGFFDAERVEVKTIVVPNPAIEGLSADQYELVSEKVSYRLAQRPGAHVVLKYVRPVVKLLATQTLHGAAAPESVIRGSRADVSFVAGLMVDKFAWHLPLHRQHQRLTAEGFRLSRQWLTQLVQAGSSLLEPIYEAQLKSIRTSRVIAMDEVPIKAGLDKSANGVGKMHGAYFWPIYGEHDEVCFPFSSSRKHDNVQAHLGTDPPPGAVLLSDGYAAYEAYAKKTGTKQAQCWAHTRRNFFEAQDAEPAVAEQALSTIGQLYRIEQMIRECKLSGQAKLAHRQQHSKPVVEQFFNWIDHQFARQGLLPSNPITKALAYARERRAALQVFVDDADVPIDTNHVERALRVIPLGRKNWNFCWTELGAQHVGLVQSLIVTCKLHQIDPYDYLVDVLQRIAITPNRRVAELTPRIWKTLYAANPLRSALHNAD
jgi:transposase